MLKTRQARNGQRRGVILMVVLALLTLFAIVGLTFVLYASAAADNARVFREAESQGRSDLDPEMALALFLGQLIYDAPDDETGVYSALRGHSLARTMYGNCDELNRFSVPPFLPPLNDKPYNGTGPLHYASLFPNSTLNPSPAGVDAQVARDNKNLVNFTFFRGDVAPNPYNLPFLRDPERLLARFGANPTTPPNPNTLTARGPFTGGFNPSYTYPDQANMFLAVINPVTGQVIMPSFHRPWLFGPLSNPAHVNWTNQEGKYLTLRPRPADMGPGFPYPEDDGGDVKNLWWAPGGNDSIWIDINAPVVTLPDGRKVKMLVAPLLLDLDGRVNLNVHGNVNGNNGVNAASPFHAGLQGWGPWEVNLTKVLFGDSLANPAAAAEWRNLFFGNAAAATLGNRIPRTPVVGRYGLQRQPLGGTYLGGTQPRAYGPADLNGTYDQTGPGIVKGLPTDLYRLSQLNDATNRVVAYQAFPRFPTEGYGNAKNLPPFADETVLHPLFYNVLRPQPGNRQLPLSGLAALLRGAGLTAGDTNSEAMTSDLLRLCPQNFDLSQLQTADPLYQQKLVQILRARNLVTTLSMDLDRPGAVPYIWDPAATTNWAYTIKPNTGTPPIPPPFPTGNAITTPFFPSLQQLFPTRTAQLPADSEFDPATWRSVRAGLGRLDLNRTLRRYPPVDISGTTRQMFNTADPAISQAQDDRQQFAKDIFDYLRAVTGAPPFAPSGKPGFQENRWLAQLAVNIVDFIDEDDYITPFNWFTNTATTPNTPYFVYGTELPRLVLNEVYTQWTNDPGDPQGNASFRVGVWLELLNTLYSPPNPANGGKAWPYGTASGYQDDGNVWLEVSKNAKEHYSAYRVILADATKTATGYVLDDTGTPSDVNAIMNGPTGATPWFNVTLPAQQGRWKALPVNQQYAEGGTADQNTGFYTLGPTPTQFPNGEYWMPTGGLTATANELSYLYTPPTPTTQPQPDVFVQRLLCPYLEPNPDPTKPNYNPYITVDYVKWDNRASPASPLRLQDGRRFFGGINPNYVPLANRVSFGRNQPYAGAADVSQLQLLDQRPITPATGQPKHTFFRHNAREDANGTDPATPIKQLGNGAGQDPNQTLRVPFDWLVHLDRQLISPMELLFVSGYKPHELTQVFVQGTTPTNGVAQSHRAPWFYENPTFGSSRLHRFLEFVQTHSQAAGVRPGGRVPGKININTLWDIQVFRALCDAQLGNAFRDPSINNNVPQPDTFVDQVFARLMQQRTPNFPLPGQPDVAGATGPGDRPFWSLSAGLATGADALTNNPRGTRSTLLRADVPGVYFDRLLDPYLRDDPPPILPPVPPIPPAPPQGPTAQRNPYQRYEMLNKLFNNLTTRSNVFAAWLTVGFFEVTDDTTRPVKLGAEVGKAEGRNVRHRMFAIIDRTNLKAYESALTANITVPANQNSVTIDLTTSPPFPMTGSHPSTLRNWAVQEGSVLTFDPDTDLSPGVPPVPPGVPPVPIEVTVVVQKDLTGQKVPAGHLFITYNRPPGIDTSQPFTRPTGSSIISRGNPGPWPRYDPRQDTAVVPYFAVID